MASGVWIAIIIGAFIVWGIFGGLQTKSLGYTCDLGSPGFFCLVWHENPLGAFDRILKDVSKELSNDNTQNKQPVKDTRTPEEKAREGISSCQDGNGIVVDTGKDGGVACSWSDTEQSRRLKEEGYTALTPENIDFIISCIKENKDPVISANSLRCEEV